MMLNIKMYVHVLFSGVMRTEKQINVILILLIVHRNRKTWSYAPVVNKWESVLRTRSILDLARY